MDKFSPLRESIETGFIDNYYPSNENYRPQFLTNNPKNGDKVLTTLLKELSDCDEYWFSVAFITSGGVASLINILDELNSKNIKGKILVSSYLNFSQPEAMRRLLQFDNIDLRIATTGNFHSKGYLFKKGEIYNLIIGSSNLTQTALSTNKEWNLKVSTSLESQLYLDALNSFQSEFEKATIVSEDFLKYYEKDWFEVRKKSIQNDPIHTGKVNPKIKPNRMQQEALDNLAKLRLEGHKKALLISATGTGKTFLSAFDVQRLKPKRILFLVHRLTIAEKAKQTFEYLLGSEKEMGIYSGNRKEYSKDYLFSTVQTFSRTENLEKFKKDEFDYIIIDETHRAAADSYKRVMNYFKPDFYLGMTATPERTDGQSVFELFDHTIAYEIRLHDALEEDMLCPFHYYGVSDLIIDDEEVDDKSSFNLLASSERVDQVISKSQFYGTDTGEIRGLIFCSEVKEAKKLSLEFNARGFNTVALTGENSPQERGCAIEKIESVDSIEKLDYIFTVDIFNEGVDIPKINQIIMLRPTQSAIIFVQQLGRGLRKAANKEYLTVIDFIGNYSNNFLIPIALYGDNSYNKDQLRKLMNSGSSFLPGASTINFDRISKQRIYDAIDKANLQLKRDLSKDYDLLKHKIGKVPTMDDFVRHGSRDPYTYVKYSKSYYNFVEEKESTYRNELPVDYKKLLEYFSSEINNGKRSEESYLLKLLIQNRTVEIDFFKQSFKNEFGIEVDNKTFESVLLNLNFKFIKKEKSCVELVGDRIHLGSDLQNALANRLFESFLLDGINYSIQSFKKVYKEDQYVKGLIRYQKYGRKDVCRLLNWEKDISSTVYGYRTKGNITPCFVTYNKDENLEGDINYNDHFVNPSIFAWESRSNRRLESSEIQNVINSDRILLFIKKGDGEGTDFYYIGDVSIVNGSIVQGQMPKTNAPVVHFKFKLDKSVEDSLYQYLID